MQTMPFYLHMLSFLLTLNAQNSFFHPLDRICPRSEKGLPHWGIRKPSVGTCFATRCNREFLKSVRDFSHSRRRPCVCQWAFVATLRQWANLVNHTADVDQRATRTIRPLYPRDHAITPASYYPRPMAEDYSLRMRGRVKTAYPAIKTKSGGYIKKGGEHCPQKNITWAEGFRRVDAHESDAPPKRTCRASI